MQLGGRLSDVTTPADGSYCFCVQKMSHGTFGVYANMVLIADHTALDAAEAHCKRLSDQQAADDYHPLMRQTDLMEKRH